MLSSKRLVPFGPRSSDGLRPPVIVKCQVENSGSESALAIVPQQPTPAPPEILSVSEAYAIL